MRQGGTTRRRVVALGLLAVCVCPAMAQTSPVVERYVWPPVGARWTYREESSGVLGSGVKSQLFERLPDRAFLGEQRIATTRGVDVLLFTEEGAGVAVLREDRPAMRYLEPVPYFRWPMHVGAHWSVEQRFVSFARPHIQTVPFDVTVEAWETIVTPAGSFEAFRIVTLFGPSRTMRWWCPSIGVSVKIVTETRTSDGKEGRRELVLTDYQAKP